MELFDTHCHIQSIGSSVGERITREMWAKAGDTNADEVLRRADDAGVTRRICIGCDVADSRLAVDFAGRHENCWASVGIHPHEAAHHLSSAAQKEFAGLINSPKVVAIGECGLDYFYEHSSPADQAKVLKFQIALALEHELPMIFHVREAFDDFWPIFEQYHTPERPIRGVLHSFTDSRANMERALKHGLYLGVNGIATFTKNTDQLAVYRAIPLEHLLLETDAPFLTPAPYRGKNTCEPYHVRTVAEFLAEGRDETVESLAAFTTENARQLFGI